MIKNTQTIFTTVLLLLLVFAFIPSEGWASNKYVERVERSTDIIQDQMDKFDAAIPRSLFDNAECISSIRVYKAGFIIGARGGKGVTSCRTADGQWGAPMFTKLGGLSLGWQIGVQWIDLIVVFFDKKAPDVLSKTGLKFGVDASVAAGPTGRDARAGVDYKLKTTAVSYSRSKGLFIGIALDGAILGPDKKANKNVYGSDLSARDILDLESVSISSELSSYPDIIEFYEIKD